MKLRYKLTKSDLNAYLLDYGKQSARMRLARRLNTVTLAILSAAVSFSIALRQGSNLAIILWLIGLGLITFSFWLYWPKMMAGGHRKISEERSLKSILCIHEAQITQNFLIEKNRYSESKYRWKAIDLVTSTPRHTFAYLDSGAVHIFPKEGVLKGDYEKFSSNLKKMVGKRAR